MYKKETSSPPAFNTVKVEILTNNAFEPCHGNSREPIPFETEFFKGITFIVIRTDPYDPPYEHFFIGRRRLFEVQVQGKFKRMPKGEVYVGAEAGNKLELGLITRSIAKAAITLAGTMATNLHSSLGDLKEKELYQLPHVVAPIFTTFDKIIVTPEGETPPPLGTPFIEDIEYRKQRLKFHKIKDANISLTSTYSFSVNTSNINLINWTLVGIPMIRPMDLRIFLADSPIRLVGYEIPDSILSGPNKTTDHPVKELNYVFNMMLTSVVPNTELEVDLPTHSGSEDEGDDLQEENDELLAGGGIEGGTSDVVVITDEDLQLDLTEVSPRTKQRTTKELLLDNDNDYQSPNEQSDEDDMDAAEISTKLASEITINMNDQRSRRRSSTGKGLRGWIKKRMSLVGPKSPQEEVVETNELAMTNGSAGDVTTIESTEEFKLTDYDLESTGDLEFCPGSVETFKEGHRRVYYFIPVHFMNHSSSTNSNVIGTQQQQFANTTTTSVSIGSAEEQQQQHLDLSASDMKLRPYSEIMKLIPMLSIPNMHKNRRLSSVEKRRRQIIESYSQLLKQDNPTAITALTKFTSSLTQINNCDKDFLDGNTSVNECQINKTQAFQGSVAVASSRRHWVEYSMILTKRDVFFYKQQKTSKSLGNIKTARRHEMRIRMFDIVSVQPMFYHDIPISGYAFFQIETFSRIYYCMVRSEVQVNEWIQAFVHFQGRDILVTSFIDTPEISIGNSMNPANKIDLECDAYLAKSGCWKLDKKRILNYRRISFNPNVDDSSTKNLNFFFPIKSMNPNNFIEDILTSILYISQPEINKVTPSHWVSFMNKISYLQTMDISNLTENERAAFFLNLYHIMVIHGSLIVGSPPAWNHWNAFFNNITYLFSYEIISISDVEHNILRSAMARPSSLSIIPIPNHKFPGLALTQKDFRLNFCINNGSKSMPRMIPIYKPDKLDEQLDEMTKLMLLKNTEVDSQRKTILLPKALIQDFISTNNSNIITNNNINNNNTLTHTQQMRECLRVLLSYFSKDDRDFIARALVENIHLNIKFKNHNLRCRKLCLYNPTSANYYAHIDKISIVKTDNMNNSKNKNELIIDKVENSDS